MERQGSDIFVIFKGKGEAWLLWTGVICLPSRLLESSASTDHKDRPQQQSSLVPTRQLTDPGNNRRTLNKDTSRTLQKI